MIRLILLGFVISAVITSLYFVSCNINNYDINREMQLKYLNSLEYNNNSISVYGNSLILDALDPSLFEDLTNTTSYIFAMTGADLKDYLEYPIVKNNLSIITIAYYNLADRKTQLKKSCDTEKYYNYIRFRSYKLLMDNGFYFPTASRNNLINITYRVMFNNNSYMIGANSTFEYFKNFSSQFTNKIYLIMPVSKEYRDNLGDEKFKLITNLLTKQNATIINYYSTFEDELFYDAIHLNMEGRKIFTERLANDIFKH